MATCKAYSNKPCRRETGLLVGMTNERPIGCGLLGLLHRLIFKTNKNIKHTFPANNFVESTRPHPSIGTKCKNIVSHIPFAPR